MHDNYQRNTVMDTEGMERDGIPEEKETPRNKRLEDEFELTYTNALLQ
jgi:hypothetical protein